LANGSFCLQISLKIAQIYNCKGQKIDIFQISQIQKILTEILRIELY